MFSKFILTKKLSMRIVNQKDIDQLMNTDDVFRFIAGKYGNPPDWSRPEGFISLSRIILEQQLSLASANAHFIKLNSYLHQFTPADILRLSDAEMRECQISRQKALYLRELSMAIISGDINLEELRKLKEPEVRQKLTSIKGIGDWTADIYLMFCLQSSDIFPMGDIAIVNTMKELCGLKSKEEITVISDKWKPLRSLAAYFLWHYYLNRRSRSAEAYVPV